jgi:hypothetical protein
LFHHAAHLRNTVTIFTSDHGAKASDFAAYTTQGRQEVFQPILFIIIPYEVSKSLGPEVMNALALNQNRLVGLEDLHHSLVAILDTDPNIWATHKEDHPENWDLHAGSDPKKWVLHADPNGHHRHPNVGVMPTRLRGLFKPVPLDRTCEQMTIRRDVLCLCEGVDTSVANDSEIVQWAAEFALGTLNNRQNSRAVYHSFEVEARSAYVRFLWLRRMSAVYKNGNYACAATDCRLRPKVNFQFIGEAFQYKNCGNF